MAQQGVNTNRKGLKKLLVSRREEVAQQSAQVISERQNKENPKAEQELTDRGVDKVLNKKRGLVERTYWAIIWLSTGDKVLVEAQHQRDRIPSEKDILEGKVPELGQFNKDHIVRIEVFTNKKDVNKKEKEYSKAKTKEGKELIKTIKKLFKK